MLELSQNVIVSRFRPKHGFQIRTENDHIVVRRNARKVVASGKSERIVVAHC